MALHRMERIFLSEVLFLTRVFVNFVAKRTNCGNVASILTGREEDRYLQFWIKVQVHCVFAVE